MFKQLPHAETVSQQLANHRSHGSLANPLPLMRGQWPGEESSDELLMMLRK
ncbi:MAG: hypothetical protein AAF587_43095 [Bacteroidota bacterium]